MYDVLAMSYMLNGYIHVPYDTISRGVWPHRGPCLLCLRPAVVLLEGVVSINWNLLILGVSIICTESNSVFSLN